MIVIKCFHLVNRRPSTDGEVLADVWEAVAAVVAKLAEEWQRLQVHHHQLERLELAVLETFLERHSVSHHRRPAEELFGHVIALDVLRPVEVLEPSVPAVLSRRVIPLKIEVVRKPELTTVVLSRRYTKNMLQKC